MQTSSVVVGQIVVLQAAACEHTHEIPHGTTKSDRPSGAALSFV